MSLENTLYRKYRPMVFADMVGQNKVTRSLRNAFKNGRLTHAFLLTGTKGSGKTTAAKILAKLSNCEQPTAEHEPCNKCPNCKAANAGTHPDILEMDAASNRGIDNIRQLISETAYSPSLGQCRVTIIDEAHMLTNEAFNALLKTLEEPPAGVRFILVTTDFNKVPATIVSRCAVHRFTPISAKAVGETLLRIAKAEKMPLAELGAMALAAETGGSLRDAIGTLQQVRDYAGDDEITAEVVYDFLGVTSSTTLATAVDLVMAKDLPRLLAFTGEILDEGTDPVQLVGDLEKYLRKAFLLSVSPENRKAFYSPQAELKELTRQAEVLGTARCLELMEVAGRTLYRLGTNAVPRLTLEAAFTYMAFPEYDSGDVGVNAKVAGLESRLGERVDRLSKVVGLLAP